MSPKTSRGRKPKDKQRSSTEKRGRGAPSLYRPEYCKAIIDAGKHGTSFSQFASDIGVVVDTLLEWKKVHPEFSGAYKRAKQNQENFWATIGSAGILGRTLRNSSGDVVNPKFNTVAWIFWMKARFGWRDDAESDPEDSDLEMDFG